MATLKRINPWVTGEIITAEGLNGAKTGTWMLKLSEEESSNFAQGTLDITIMANLTVLDLINMIIVYKDSVDNKIMYCSYIEEDDDLLKLSLPLYKEMLYNPTTGRLYSLDGK